MRHDLEEQYFGEGLTLFNDQFYQLTWKAEKAFVYNRDLIPVGERTYKGQGWGLTTAGKQLIFSDGSPEIQFIDPETFEIQRSVWVKKKGGMRAGELNELEYFGNRIFANVYQRDLIYEIHPDSGDVTKVIDLGGLWPKSERPEGGVLNGIAIMPAGNQFRMLVTGKLCPHIFEIKLHPRKR